MRRIQCLILISVTILLGFTRCDGKDNENLTERQTIQLDDATRVALYCDYSKDAFCLKKYENGKETASVRFNSVNADVDFGYGNVQNIKHFPVQFYAFSNTIAVVKANDFNKPTSIYVDIYSHNLEKTNGFNVSKTENHVMNFVQWGSDEIIIYVIDHVNYEYGNAYLLRYTQYGDFKKEEGTNNYIELPSSVIKHPVNDYEFIHVRPENAFRSTIKYSPESVHWSKKYSDFVENNSGSGSNPPIVTMSDYKIESNILSVDVVISYYNGETGNDTLRFDITSGDIIE